MAFIFFLFGTLMGSFFNVCIYRIPVGKSIVNPPSACGECGTRLKPMDLFPILSYIFLKGKCRYCKAKISPRYMIVETITGSLYMFLYLKFGFTIFLFKAIIFSSLLLIISFIDFDHKIIPDSLNLVLFISGLLLNIFFRDLTFKSMIFGFLIGGGFLFVIALIGPMGGGDIKLMAGAGLFLGIKFTIMALLLSFIIGGLVSIILLLFKLVKPKALIPFGPFLCIGSFISFIFGKEILIFYINTFILG